MGRLENPIQDIVDREKPDLPLFIHFEHVPTNFVHLNLILGTDSVPISLRPLLGIYLENFFSSPVLRDGKRVEFEQIIMDLEKDTVGYGIGSAHNLGNPEVLAIHLEVEAEKYDTAIKWLKSLLLDPIFDLTVFLDSRIPMLNRKFLMITENKSNCQTPAFGYSRRETQW
jgi:Zn-dependent M16 (insulinase) family peptidase